ncbi:MULTISPECIES: EamA family transporter [unclassified Arthrobacter]|uniref:EamA family transporter n=1 Tax=unclassified Arthrobacter TaxID=235627 RepID=UPI001C854628|nr:EamA family transporter [Arthrobacter sp. MAHUQ-56]MBX7444672.1 EamA family transporter [Arthrobacter sp. MAHUQ-56]
MLSKPVAVIAITALAPAVWGTTYIVTSELLPDGRPLLSAVLRALPAGLLLLALTRRLPKGGWWWKAFVLGILNIGAFFALLFVAAYLLPGGLAATVGAIQPLIVALLASRMLGERLTGGILGAGAAGVAGVALLVLQSQSRLDPVGVLAALGGAGSMALGIVLSKKWGQPEAPLAVTSWQLISGGIVLVPPLLLMEGLPPSGLSPESTAGFAYLTLIGTAFAYTVWYRGIQLLPAGSISFLSLLSPVVAVLAGWIVLGQSLSAGQALGGTVVLASLSFVLLRNHTKSTRIRIRQTRATGSPSPGPGVCPEAR